MLNQITLCLGYCKNFQFIFYWKTHLTVIDFYTDVSSMDFISSKICDARMFSMEIKPRQYQRTISQKSTDLRIKTDGTL